MRVAAFGDINIDVAVGIDSPPEPGGEAFASSSRVGLGGSAVNTAVSLVRLGLPTTVVGQVGADAFGDFAIAELAAAGVDATGVVVSPSETTGLNLVAVTPDGERTMIGARGANRAFAADPGWVAEIDWLHMSGYALLADPQRSAARRAMARAKQRSIPISIDVPSEVGSVLGETLIEDIAGVAVVSTGGSALQALAGIDDPVGRLLTAEVGMVAVTAGGRPCRLVNDSDAVTLTPPVVTAVDTTGAGDAFVAGLVAAILSGLDLGPAAVVASTLGTAAITHRGAGLALGDRSVVDEILAAGPWTDADAAWLATAAGFLGRSLRGPLRPAGEATR
ncbi:MAG: carbohydrate kinase family protein [Acidimicrobiia bacterium]